MVVLVQGTELHDAVTEGLRSVNLLGDKAGDKLVASYRSGPNPRTLHRLCPGTHTGNTHMGMRSEDSQACVTLYMPLCTCIA